MPIFDQGYQHWTGRLSGHGWRWLAIARHGVRSGFKIKAMRLVLFLAWAPALFRPGDTENPAGRMRLGDHERGAYEQEH